LAEAFDLLHFGIIELLGGMRFFLLLRHNQGSIQVGVALAGVKGATQIK
jgi:hypothetical protein